MPQDSGIVKGLIEIFGDFKNILQIGLIIGGVIAFGVIIYAGFLYLIGADNASKQKDALDWIKAAVLGLAILTFGYLILTTINPSLLTVKELTLNYAQDDVLIQVSPENIALVSQQFSDPDNIISSYPLTRTFEITSLYGFRPSINNSSCKKLHGGIDFGVSCGNNVLAAGDGKVSIGAQTGYGTNIYGDNHIVITHKDGVQTVYGHLKSASVTNGQEVTAGTVIGISGGAADQVGVGLSTDCHLHFEVRKDGATRDINNLYPTSVATKTALDEFGKADSLPLCQ